MHLTNYAINARNKGKFIFNKYPQVFLFEVVEFKIEGAYVF